MRIFFLTHLEIIYAEASFSFNRAKLKMKITDKSRVTVTLNSLCVLRDKPHISFSIHFYKNIGNKVNLGFIKHNLTPNLDSHQV